MAQVKKYKAFISYNHTDAKWAKWLHRRLETYKTPARLLQAAGDGSQVTRQLSPIFRDQDDLASSADLSQAIRTTLSLSENLIVICSPAAFRSHWVNKEIEYFQSLGRSRQIFALIVAGSPIPGDIDDCFPPALRRRYDADGKRLEGDIEPIAADARDLGDGRKLALLKLVAGMLHVDLDELRQRDQQRRNAQMAITTASALLVSIITIALAINATLARNESQQRQQQAEQLLGFMVGDLRKSLQPIGRLDLLESVARQAQVYFETVDVRALSDSELIRQAEVLTQLGEIRFEQLQYDEALSAFREAFERSAALYENDSTDGDRLFSRSQAEFWIGYVAWRSGAMDEARHWLTRYRDSALFLSTLDPERNDWLREVGYGMHNLAVIHSETGNLEQAIEEFADEVELLDRLIARSPSGQLQRDRADSLSWLGNVYFEQGKVIDALNNYLQAEEQIRRFHDEQPDDAARVQGLAFATEKSALFSTYIGDHAGAEIKILESLTLFDGLVERDASNADWQRSALRALGTRAHILHAQGDITGAASTVTDVINSLEQFVAAGLTDHNLHHQLASAHVLNSSILFNSAELELALASTIAVESNLLKIMESTPLNDERLGLLSLAMLLRGNILVSMERQSDAQASWGFARDLLSDVVVNTDSPFLLDPWARLLHASGAIAEAAAVIELLGGSGYRPIIQWPD